MASILSRLPGVAFITGAGGTGKTPRAHSASYNIQHLHRYVLGIGAAVAAAFVKSGCPRLAITDINPDSLAHTREVLKGINVDVRIASRAGDVSDESFIDSFMSETAKTFGRVDYAVNCAGILGNDSRSTETSVRSYNAVMDVNCKGVWLSSRAALAQMLKQEPLAEHPGQRGAIVNIASQLGIVARPGAGGLTKIRPITSPYTTNFLNSSLLCIKSCHHQHDARRCH